MSWPLFKGPLNIPSSYHTWDVYTSKLGDSDALALALSVPTDRTSKDPLTINYRYPYEYPYEYPYYDLGWLERVERRLYSAGGCPYVSMAILQG